MLFPFYFLTNILDDISQETDYLLGHQNKGGLGIFTLTTEQEKQ
jgi:hypothetical protein